MEKKKKGFITIGLFVAILVAVVSFTGAAMNNNSSEIDGTAASTEESTSVLVKTEQPAIGDITLTSEYIGKLEPDQQVIVYPKASGEVLATYFQVGDFVEEGEVLCELDSKALKSTISQSQATLAAAEAKARHSLALAQNDLETIEFNVEGGYDSSLIAAEAAVKSAENRVQTASASLTSVRRALRDHRDKDAYDFGGDEATYDQLTDQYKDAVVQAELAHEATLLGLEQAQENLRSAKMMAQERQITVNGSVEMARLNTNFTDQYLAIQKLQDTLNDYVIQAPISGIVEQRNVDVHSMASPQSPVYTISNKDIMMVAFNVPADAARNLQIGDRTAVEIGSSSFTGSVTEIGAKVNAVGLFPIKVQINGDASSLMTGLAVTVAADTQHTRNAVTLPLKYVYFKDNAAYVYAVESGIAVKKPIEIGLMDDETVEVLSGINSTTQVISTWSPDLKNGVPVEVAQGE